MSAASYPGLGVFSVQWSLAAGSLLNQDRQESPAGSLLRSASNQSELRLGALKGPKKAWHDVHVCVCVGGGVRVGFQDCI